MTGPPQRGTILPAVDDLAPAVDDLTDLAADIRVTVSRLYRTFRRHALRNGDDLTSARRSALALLEQYGPMSVSQLAAAELTQPPTMTRMVEALRVLGYLERSVDPNDGRIVRLTITDLGRKKLASTRNASNAMLTSYLEELTVEERSILAASMPILRQFMANDRPPT